jgi:hypothetical protein
VWSPHWQKAASTRRRSELADQEIRTERCFIMALSVPIPFSRIDLES